MHLEEHEKQSLLSIALDTIRHSLMSRDYSPVVDTDCAIFHSPLATFVTLRQNGTLRGCIGSLQASRPLVQDISYNAYAAAFRDPRFPAITLSDLDDLEISISLLGPQEEIRILSETDLAAKLERNIDGLVLEEINGMTATFLPAVWESLPEPEDFIRQLKLKAGLHERYWSETLRFFRYRTYTFSNRHTA